MLSELVHCLFARVAYLPIDDIFTIYGKAGSQRQAIKLYIDMRIYINISFILLSVIRDACVCVSSSVQHTLPGMIC